MSDIESIKKFLDVLYKIHGDNLEFGLLRKDLKSTKELILVIGLNDNSSILNNDGSIKLNING